MTKVVVNSDYGGFSLSYAAIDAYLTRKGKQAHWFVHNFDGRTKMETVTPVTLEDLSDVNSGIYGAVCYTSPTREGDSYFSYDDLERNDPDLVAVVEELGSKADGRFAKLRIVEVPDDVDWYIDEYDGREWVAETHRKWC